MTESKSTTLRAVMAGACLAFAFGLAAPALAEDPKMVGGAAMYPEKTIVENAMNSKDHTTLVAAVQAAGLVETLSGAGPFTVFAPTNSAFGKLPAGTVDMLVMPDNKDKLTGILTYHVVPGRLDAQALVDRIEQGGGKTMLKTVEGGMLTVARLDDKHLGVMDEAGNTARTTIFDVYQSNGVIHVIDTVLMPGM